MRRFLTVLGVLAALLGGSALWWLNHDLQPGAQALELAVDPGTPPRGVAQAVKEAEKAAGAPIVLKGFVRYALGEGIEKETSDFAAEVAAAAGGNG